MRRRRTTAAMVLTALAAAVPGAGAAAGLTLAAAGSASTSVSATDPHGDVETAFDLTRMSVSRGSDGRLRASLTLADAWKPADLRASSGVPGSLCLKVWATTAPPDQPPDYLVCATADAKGALRGSVLHERANKLPERVAGADVSRPSSRTVRLRFAQSAIGRPARISVAAEATAPGCDAVTCVDTAPDAPKALKVTLRTS